MSPPFHLSNLLTPCGIVILSSTTSVRIICGGIQAMVAETAFQQPPKTHLQAAIADASNYEDRIRLFTSGGGQGRRGARPSRGVRQDHVPVGARHTSACWAGRSLPRSLALPLSRSCSSRISPFVLVFRIRAHTQGASVAGGKSFSATCWYFGREVYTSLGGKVPASHLSESYILHAMHVVS